MRKILILIVTFVTAAPFTSINAQAPTDYFVSSAEGLTCSEVLPDNSVIALFFNVATLGVESVERGSSINLPLRVSNSNAFAIQNVTVHVRLFRTGDDAGQIISPQLYASQVVQKDLALAGGETKELEHSFVVPSALSQGTYSLSTYVETQQRFSLSGTAAYELAGNQNVEFSITEGEASGAIIDRALTQVNGVNYTSSASATAATSLSTVINGIDSTLISVVVKNVAGSGPTVGTFTWDVFSGNQPNPAALIDSQELSIKLFPGTHTQVPYQLLNPAPVDYTVVGTLRTTDDPEQSILISLGEAQTDAPGLAVFDPLDFATFTNNESSTDLLFCYTPAKLLQYQNPGLSFLVVGPTGVIGEYAVDLNDITHSPTSLADTFSFPSTPGAYEIEVSLLDSGAVVATSSLLYTHESPVAEGVPSDKNNNTTLLVLGMILLGLLILGLFLSRRSFTKLEN